MKSNMKIIKIVFINILFFCLCSFSKAQNLVLNGSFEEFTTDTIPYKPKVFENLKYWKYFTTNRTKRGRNINVLTNEELQRRLYPDGAVSLSYRNYQIATKEPLCKTVFQVPLKERLNKGSYYRLSYYIRITSFGSYNKEIVVPELVEFFIRREQLNDSTQIDLLAREEAIGMLPKERTYEECYRAFYVPMSIDFMAKGGEKYLVFGTIDTIYTKIWTNIEFDDMKLVEIDEKLANIKTLEVGSTLVMENILFETNKAVLRFSSYEALNQLADELKKLKQLRIEISGYTDNVGSEKRNNELSKERSKVIVDYLVKKGVPYERLSYRGYGSSKPIADNNTEAGRRQNRRVEITVLEK